MRLAPDENASLFSGHNFDLAGDEHIYFELYRRQQIDIGLRYMQGDDETVACFIIIVVQGTPCFPPILSPGKRFCCGQGKGIAFPGGMSLMFRVENVRPLCAKSGRFRSQLFPITDVLSNRKLMFFNNLFPVRKATNHFHRVISVVTSAEFPLMQSQLRLPDSPRIAATIHWRYLSSRQTTLPWREVAQALHARLPAGDQIPLQ